MSSVGGLRSLRLQRALLTLPAKRPYWGLEGMPYSGDTHRRHAPSLVRPLERLDGRSVATPATPVWGKGAEWTASGDLY